MEKHCSYLENVDKISQRPEKNSSICLKVFCKRAVLKNFSKFIGKNLRWCPFLCLELYCKRTPSQVPFLTFSEFLRTDYLQNVFESFQKQNWIETVRSFLKNLKVLWRRYIIFSLRLYYCSSTVIFILV